MNIPDELLAQIDKKAKLLNVSRTAYVVMTLSQQLHADEAMQILPELQKMMNEASIKIKEQELKPDQVRL
jgi:hypothetical protein